VTPPDPHAGRGPLLGILWAALVADGLVLAGLWFGVPHGLDLGWALDGLVIEPGWIDVAVPLALGLAVAIGVVHVGPRRLAAHVAERTRELLGAAGPAGRVRLALAACMTLAALDTLLGAPVASLRLRVAQTASARPALTHNRDHHHVPALLDAVASRRDDAAVVVHVEDDDPRGHVASYYAYPRLLLMAPERRAWTLRSRMDRLGVPDPTLPPAGPGPGVERSAAFARERDADLLVLRGLRLSDRGEAVP
jgi:hypothetical protein